MNHKFFELPLEKQQRMLNAAYKVFSQNSYKKAPMSEIAAEGGISKALLFHYFVNKKELYLYLWTNAMEMTKKEIAQYQTMETTDFFEMLERSLLSKYALMQDFPFMYAFSLRAYYETDPEMKEAIQKNFSAAGRVSERLVFQKIDTSAFRDDIDLKTMYDEIFYAVDGYMLKKYRSGVIDPDEIQREIHTLIGLWRKIYSQKEA